MRTAVEPPRLETDLVVHCAGVIGISRVPILNLRAVEEIDGGLSAGETKALYAAEAEQIADAIFRHLPGGTVDQLLASMLIRRASLLRVRF